MTRADLKTIIGRWVPDSTTSDREAAIKVALKSLQQELGLGEEVVSDIAVSANAASAAVPSTLFLIEHVIWNPASDYILLEAVPYSVLSGQLRKSNLDASGQPSRYASTGAKIYLWEKPSASGTLRIVGLGAFGSTHDMDDDADTVHPSFAEPSIIAYKAIVDMLSDRRQAMTVYKEVLPIFRAKLRLCMAALKGIQGQIGVPSVTPMGYGWSDY